MLNIFVQSEYEIFWLTVGFPCTEFAETFSAYTKQEKIINANNKNIILIDFILTYKLSRFKFINNCNNFICRHLKSLSIRFTLCWKLCEVVIMKVLPVQSNTNPCRLITVRRKLSQYKFKNMSIKQLPDLKGNGSGAIGGFCLGSLAGMAASIGAAFLGAPVGFGAFWGSYLVGAFGGTYLGDRLEYKNKKKLNSPNNEILINHFE